MISQSYSVAHIGLDSFLVEVETDFAPAVPVMKVVGLGDKAVQESKERIQSGIAQSGFEFPLGRITVNLAPADIAKNGASFDLPISLGILHVSGHIKSLPSDALFVGELSLNGHLRSVPGVISSCMYAKEHGFKQIFVPRDNVEEALLIDGLEVYSAKTLREVALHLNGEEPLQPAQPNVESDQERLSKGLLYSNDMAYVQGQILAKRALEIAAAGGHNVMLVGNPGSGKTMLARSFGTILPSMTKQEVIEVTQVYSVIGKGKQAITSRPFRAPHHTSSHIAIVGGGSKLRPGEISLAHRGVLFMDEFPEFKREVIETLRQPLEDGMVTISRANGQVEYPAKFILVAAANPTPSGYKEGDNPNFITVNSSTLKRYKAKFSGPIMDRIDLHIYVENPTKEELTSKTLSEKSTDIQARVQVARQIQQERYKNCQEISNSEMNSQQISAHCRLDKETEDFLFQAIEKFQLSGRSYKRILKIARTVADLAQREQITLNDVAEALQFRPKL